jgi:metal-sulfur cluster biosynthetic enzyme
LTALIKLNPMDKKEMVMNQLKSVNDPELGLNVVDLGLVYDVKVEGKVAKILMTLTFPGCPFGATVERDVREAVLKSQGIERVTLKITFDPPWDLSRVSPEAAAEIGLPV